MLRSQIPNFDQRVLAGSQKEAGVFAEPRSIEKLGRREKEAQRSNLVGMSTKSENTDLGDQIPKDDIGIFGATCEANSSVVEGQLSDRRLVTIERNDDGAGSRVPNTDTAVLVTR